MTQTVHVTLISSCQQQFLNWGWSSSRNKGKRWKWKMKLWPAEKHLLFRGQIENSKTKPASNRSYLSLVIKTTKTIFPVTENNSGNIKAEVFILNFLFFPLRVMCLIWGSATWTGLLRTVHDAQSELLDWEFPKERESQ